MSPKTKTTAIAHNGFRLYRLSNQYTKAVSRTGSMNGRIASSCVCTGTLLVTAWAPFGPVTVSVCW